MGRKRLFKNRKKTWLLIVAAVVTFPAVASASALPWEVWKDPGVIAEVRPGIRTVLASSVAPDGGPFDRHSEGDSRFVRVIDGEGVIFETEGAGAVTRIWMTQGHGTSVDLDETIRLRVRLDGADDPVIDLSLPEFFGGKIPPFLAPMVLDRKRSSGGNVSYVPLPFRRGCRISLVGAEKAKIWFQVSAMTVKNPAGIVTFTPSEDLIRWRRILDHPGTDPWPGEAGESVSGTVVLQPGLKQVLATFDGPDQITGIVLRIPPWRLGEVDLRLSFDGRTTVNMPLPWFFGQGRASCRPVRSLFIGGDQGEVYSYFPMPFHSGAEVEVELSSVSTKALKLRFAVRRKGRAPALNAALFNAHMIDVPDSVPGRDAVLLDLVGPGRLAGLAVTAGTTTSAGWAFLEGDESLWVDGEGSPSWRGTGVEDFFGGGFYFRNEKNRPEIFRQALHGMNCIGGKPQQPSMSLYRLMPTDGPVFDRSLTFEVEGGPTGEVPVRWRGVAWFYGLFDEKPVSSSIEATVASLPTSR